MSKPMLKSLAQALKKRGFKHLDINSIAGELIVSLFRLEMTTQQLKNAENNVHNLEQQLSKEVERRGGVESSAVKEHFDFESRKRVLEASRDKMKRALDDERSRILQVLRVMERVGHGTTEESRCKLLMSIAQEHNISLSSDGDNLRDLVFIVTVLLLETAGRE
jgi:hypothetical protein